MSARILVVDDQRNMRATLAMMLRAAGFDVEEAVDAEQGIEFGVKGAYDLIISDLRMGEASGLDLLREVKKAASHAEIILMTAYGTVESAVEAMRLGAHDYLQKPFTEEELLLKVQRALSRRRLEGQVEFLTHEFRERYRFENIIGRSKAIRSVMQRIVRIADTEATVLITGESGTGKELVAKAIHANSARSAKAFVPINCAAITDTLLESELFGHVRGAFTGAVTARKGLFEEADGGTFFFDEIGDMSMQLQAKLLRLIESNEVRRIGDNRTTTVDARIVAATNKDLQTMVREGKFREDLYYRLNVARFVLPPLRNRKEDVGVLVEHFVRKHSKRHGKKVSLTVGVVDYLMRQDFPGNVRELENLVDQAVAFSEGEPLEKEDFMLFDEGMAEPVDGRRSLADIVADAEFDAIRQALGDAGGNRTQAAGALGISPTTLWRKMVRHGMKTSAQ